MPNTGAPGNIDYPDDSYPVTPLEALFANIAIGVNDALTDFQDTVDDVESTRQIHTFKWPDSAARLAQTGMSDGDFGIQMDTQIIYQRVSGQWRITEQSGTFTTGAGTGTAGSSGTTFWSTIQTVTFPVPFDAPPTKIWVNCGGVDFIQWTATGVITATGFSFRVVRMVAAPTTGLSISWRAQP